MTRASASLDTKKKRAKVVLRILKKHFPTTEKFLDATTDYEFLFAVMLSAQTTDKKVNEVTPQLFARYQSLNEYATAQLQELAACIKHIGLYQSKAKNVIRTAQILIQNFEGKIPNTMEALLTLPGVGRKTANVVLGYIHGISEGIAVDTHVTRLAQKTGLTTHTDPKKIERDLMQIIPQKEWFHFTNRMIAYGRKFCPAKNHNHDACPLTLALSDQT